MTLNDLRKSTDPLALLVGMRNRELDRIAAEAQGLEFKCLSQGRFARENDRRDWQLYMPSSDLNQAYELLDSGDRRNRYVWACDIDGDGRYVELISQRLGVVQVYFEQAGSHARAVCVLAILGLLQGKDGAA